MRGLELVARQLEHVQIRRHGIALRGAQQIERRLAEIAADAHLQAGALGHAADQRRDRALAVGAGDADHRRVHCAREQLDVADDLEAARARLDEERLASDTPGEATTHSASSSRRVSSPPVRTAIAGSSARRLRELRRLRARVGHGDRASRARADSARTTGRCGPARRSPRCGAVCAACAVIAASASRGPRARAAGR